MLACTVRDWTTMCSTKCGATLWNMCVCTYVCTDLGFVIPASASEFHKSWWQPVYLATQDNIELYRRMYVRTYIRTYIGRLVYMYCTCTYLCKYNSVNPTTVKVYAYCSWCTCILSVKLRTYIHSYTRGILVVCTYIHTYVLMYCTVC